MGRYDMNAAALPSRPLAGIPINIASMDEAVHWVISTAKSERRRQMNVHLVNAYNISLAGRDRIYLDLLKSAGAVFPDGRPMVLLTKMTKSPLSQVRGPSLFEEVVSRGREVDLKHYLLGGSDETLGRLSEELLQRYPGLKIVGQYSPPFRELSNEERTAQDSAIEKSEAEVVWVGLGTPKQDYEAARIASGINVMTVAVGAAFDFAAGTKPAAPAWMAYCGIEWVFRLCTEPRRLWRRYLFGNAGFIWVLLRDRIRSQASISEERADDAE